MEKKQGPGRPPKVIPLNPESSQEPEAPKESIGRVHPKDYRIFYGPHDKGAAKPAFCYPQRIQTLQEEVRSMERNLDMGFVSPERKMAYEARLRERKTRLDGINKATEDANKIIEENKDFWAGRRKELGREIRSAMPSRKDVEKRRVNPYRVSKMEKEGGLGEMKREFIVISRLLKEESNISFLQRD